MPVIKSEEENVYKDDEDPEIEALFEGFEPSHLAGGAFPSMNTEKQCSISSSSHSLNDIIFCKEFPTWPTNVKRQLIREY